ncbi:hypothetical protein OAD47_00130 [Pseudomonadales bacterium]|nr:hypothetical protein [Pseudomonadales bacterium]
MNTVSASALVFWGEYWFGVTQSVSEGSTGQACVKAADSYYGA